MQTAEPSKIQDPTIAKQSAIDTDKKIYNIIIRAEKTNKIIKGNIDDLSNGKITELTLYDNIKTAIDNMDNFTLEIMDIKSEGARDYIDMCGMYFYDSKEYLKSTKKYIEKQDIKDLSESKESLQRSQDDIISLSSGRIKFLTDNGVTSDELEKIISTE